MTEPQPTVRGLLAEILAALAPSTVQAELLTEMRFLNRALFGATGAEPGATPPTSLWGETFYDAYPTEATQRPLAELVRKGLMTETTGIFGDPIRPQFLAELIRYNFYDNDFADFRNTVNAIRQLVDDLRTAAVVQEVTSASPTAAGGSLRLQWEILRMLSQSFPLAAGNDIYSALISIKDESARAADCCEENSGGGEPTNPPPVFSLPGCDNCGTLHQVGSVTDLGETTGGDPPASRMYGYTVPWTGTEPIAAVTALNGAAIYELGGEAGLEVLICWGWNFTGQDLPRFVGFDAGITPAEADSRLWSPPGDVAVTGTNSATIIVGDAPGQVRYISPRAEWEEGRAPSLNVWFKACFSSEF